MWGGVKFRSAYRFNKHCTCQCTTGTKYKHKSQQHQSIGRRWRAYLSGLSHFRVNGGGFFVFMNAQIMIAKTTALRPYLALRRFWGRSISSGLGPWCTSNTCKTYESGSYSLTKAADAVTHFERFGFVVLTDIMTANVSTYYQTILCAQSGHTFIFSKMRRPSMLLWRIYMR